jgi:hypothetical protein
MFNFRLKLRIIWIAILAVAVLALIWLAIIPSGKITYSTNFKGFNDFISQLTPKERINSEKDGTEDIIGDPGYFSLRTPRPFSQAKVTIKFQASQNLPIVEAGVSTDGRTWQYDLQPLYNAKLEDLTKNWTALRQGGLLLLQRTQQYATVNDFLKNLPPVDQVAVYNYNLKTNFSLPDYQPQHGTSTMCRPLVGAYQFYTYIKNENLSDDFVFQDLNKIAGTNPVDINVYSGDQLIDDEHLDDDGVIDGSGAQKPWRHLQLDLANLPEGIYKIDIRADGDIVTRSIVTGQSKMAFINNLPLADAPEVSCGLNLFTDGQTFSVQTSHPADLGRIIISQSGNSTSSQELDVSQTYQIFTAGNLPPEGSQIVLSHGGISLSGDGLFSFDSSQLIDPRIKTVDAGFNADSEGVNYVLARYTPPVKEGDWLVASADFNLNEAYRMWNKYYFLLSAPGLSASDSIADKVRIKSIKIDLTGTSLWSKISNFLKK